MYLNIVDHVLYTKPEGEKQSIKKAFTSEDIRLQEKLAKSPFEKLDCFNLPILKFHVLDHIVNDISQFGAFNFSDASPLQHLNYVFKKLIKMTSMRRCSTMEGTVKAMNASVAVEERELILVKQ